MKGICFFDFDGTIIRGDSLWSFALFTLGKFKVSKAILKSSPAILGWKLGLSSNSRAKQKLFSNLFKGISSEEFKSKGLLYASEIEKLLRHDIMRILREHQSAGRRIVIVSASIGDWIKPWANRNGIGTVLATEAECDSFGKLTGQFATQNCVGREKVNRIKEAFPDLSLYEVWAYGDSSSDNPMLALANHPHIV